MPCHLRREEVVTLRVLAEKGKTKTEIGRTLGVTEGTVRYHLRRAEQGATDGRKDRPHKAEQVAGVIEAWYEMNKNEPRPINVKELWEHLVHEHDYEGSYKSVLRFYRAKYPRPRRRTYRRVETPPGAQTQTDWAEYPRVNIGDGPEPLSAFVMSLSHSRKPVVIWRRSKDQLSWLESHNEAYRRLQGVAAVNRIDNVKTAISHGAGAWGVINPTYQSYARAVGFHIDACQPRAANAKGKAESKVRLSRLRVSPGERPYDGLEELQDWSDRRLERWTQRAVCPATGLTVAESWQRELEHLAEVPLLPEPFDVAVTRPVNKDCMVYFENRSYTVPFRFVGLEVEVHGCSGKVQIWAEGEVQAEYPRNTNELVLIDPSCYEGDATDRVTPPLPLGKMGRRLQELMDMPVASRPMDLYAALAEVAR
jgi:transposase